MEEENDFKRVAYNESVLISLKYLGKGCIKLWYDNKAQCKLWTVIAV